MSHEKTTQTNSSMQMYLILLAGIFAISSSSIFIRYAQADGLPSLVIAAGRLSLSGLIMTVLLRDKTITALQQLTRRDLFMAFASGLFLSLHFATWVTSLEYTSVLVSVVLVTTSPIWVALLEFIFLKMKVPRGVVIGLVIAIVGGIIIGIGGSGGDDANTLYEGNLILGGGLALMGAITVACYWILGRSLRTTMSVGVYTWLVYSVAGVLLWIMVGVTGTPITGFDVSGYLWIIPMALFPQLVGHTSLNYAVGFLPATIVSTITQLEPIGSAILAYLLFAEVPLPLQILGSGVILGGVLLANWAQSRKNDTK